VPQYTYCRRGRKRHVAIGQDDVVVGDCTGGRVDYKDMVSSVVRRCRLRDDGADQTILRVRQTPAEVVPKVDPLDDVARVQVDDVDHRVMSTVEADEQRVAGRVCPGEARVSVEGAPRSADEAEAAQRLGREAEKDLVQHVRRQHAAVGKGLFVGVPYERRRHHR